MSDAAPDLGERAAALRRSFDQGFAEPVRPDAAASEDFLGIVVGSEAYALRLT